MIIPKRKCQYLIYAGNFLYDTKVRKLMNTKKPDVNPIFREIFLICLIIAIPPILKLYKYFQ